MSCRKVQTRRCSCAGRWVADLCSRLRAFEAGESAGTLGDRDKEGKGTQGERSSCPSSEFTGMLQLLKATLQATELFSDRHADLPKLVHVLLSKRRTPEQGGSPVSLLESLINTLCSGAAISTAHAYKIAFILCICVARHEEWRLSEELFGRYCLTGVVFSVLESALHHRQAANAQRILHASGWPDHGQPFEAAHAPTATPLRVKMVGPVVYMVRPLFFGRSSDGSEAAEAAGKPAAEGEADDVACTSAEVYLERVRAGMAADKAPAVAVRSLLSLLLDFCMCIHYIPCKSQQSPHFDTSPMSSLRLKVLVVLHACCKNCNEEGSVAVLQLRQLHVAAQAVASAIIQQEGTLCASGTAVSRELDRLKDVLEEFMPSATGFGKPIDYDRRDNICRGAATDAGLVPQETAEDSFLDAAKGTPPESRPLQNQKDAPHRDAARPQAKQKVAFHRAAAIAGTGAAASGAEKSRKGSLKAAQSLNAELRKKMAELEELKRLKAQQEQQRSKQGSAAQSGSTACGSNTTSSALSSSKSPGAEDHPRQVGRGEQAKQAQCVAVVGDGPADDDSASAAAAATAAASSTQEKERGSPVRQPAIINKMEHSSKGAFERTAAGVDSASIRHPFVHPAVPDFGGNGTKSEQAAPLEGAKAQPCKLQDVTKEGVAKPGKPVPAGHSSLPEEESLLDSAVEEAAVSTHTHAKTSSDAAELHQTRHIVAEEAAFTSANRGCTLQSHAVFLEEGEHAVEIQATDKAGIKIASRNTCQQGGGTGPAPVTMEEQVQRVQLEHMKKFRSSQGRTDMDVDPPVGTPRSPPPGPPLDPPAAAAAAAHDEEMSDIDVDEAMEDATVDDWEDLFKKADQPAVSAPQASYASVTAGTHSTTATAQGNGHGPMIARSPLVTVMHASGNAYGPTMRDKAQANSGRGSGAGTEKNMGQPSVSVGVGRRPPPGCDWAKKKQHAADFGDAGQGQGAAGARQSYSQAAQRQGSMGGRSGGARVAGNDMGNIGLVDYRK